MTDTKIETETIELTNALLQCLLNMTRKADTEPLRSLALNLHGVRWNMGNRWVVEVDVENVKTIHTLIIAYTRGRRTTTTRTRFHNYLCGESALYHRLFHDWKDAE